MGWQFFPTFKYSAWEEAECIRFIDLYLNLIMKTLSLLITFFLTSITVSVSGKNISSTEKAEPVKISSNVSSAMIYDSLNLQQFGLSKRVFDLAMKGWKHLKRTGKVVNESIISIVDFSQPSNKKRLYVIDLAGMQLLFNTYVAHGRRSGKETAIRFSNRPKSLESSVGFYVTAEPYIGSNGYSLRLNGMEHGFNNNALRREIVLHGADYVSEDYISANGCLGRSWGFPAVPMEQSHDIIDSIKSGSCLFIYSPQVRYLKGSKVLNSS